MSTTSLRIADWRSEILQAMFWLRSEGYGEAVEATLLERFLGVDSPLDLRYLDRLLDEGDVERVGVGYGLSEAGSRKAAVAFAASFEEFTRPSLPECGRSSWCPAFAGSSPWDFDADA